jgi:hypothetical protein
MLTFDESMILKGTLDWLPFGLASDSRRIDFKIFFNAASAVAR